MKQIDEFLKLLTNFSQQRRRDMPWRSPEPGGRFDPYKILVSEIMLQQTQVSRVIPKYISFLQKFPTVDSLAHAGLAEVLSEWVGLGYNRRAKYLHEAARLLVDRPEPWSYEDLVACKGVGPNTAAAVMVYSYDLPMVYVETNIRTVIIHHFFDAPAVLPALSRRKSGSAVLNVPKVHHRSGARLSSQTARGKGGVADEEKISDKAILSKLTAVTEQAFIVLSPREFYWAMMDYGTYLKATAGNLSRQSKHYAKQSTFHGSRRQLRGQVIRLLSEGSIGQLELEAQLSDKRLGEVLAALEQEGMVILQDNLLMLYNDVKKP